MNFLCRLSGLTLENRVRKSGVLKVLKFESLLLHIERSQLRWFGHQQDASCGANLGTSNWEAPPGQTHYMLDGLSIQSGLGTPQNHLGRAGGHGWEEGLMGYFVFATTTFIEIGSRSKI